MMTFRIGDFYTPPNNSFKENLNVDFFKVHLDMQSLGDVESINGLSGVTPSMLADSIKVAPEEDETKIKIKIQEYNQAPGVIESEYNWTCLVKNADFIKNAESWVDIEQWQYWIDKNTENRLGGKQRVRKTTDSRGKSTYEFTIKIRQAQLKSENYTVNKEYNNKISEEMFNLLKFMYPNGQLKRRYTIPIEGSDLKFEVDAYYKPDGKLSDYVSIELETNSRLETIPPLPEGVMLIEDAVLVSKLKKDIFTINHFRDG